MSVKNLIVLAQEIYKSSGCTNRNNCRISYKSNEFLYLQPSGSDLFRLKENDFIKLDRKLLTESLNDNLLQEPLQNTEFAIPDDAWHNNLLKQRFVLFIRSAVVNGLVCSSGGKDACDKLFAGGAIWISEDYPGIPAGNACKLAINKYINRLNRQPEMLFIQNFGLLLAAETVEALAKLYTGVIANIKNNYFKLTPESDVSFDIDRAVELAPFIRMLVHNFGPYKAVSVKYLMDVRIFRYINSLSIKKILPLTPDFIQSCGADILSLPYEEDIENQYALLKSTFEEYYKSQNSPPRVVVAQNVGIFIIAEDKEQIEASGASLLEMAEASFYTEAFGGEHCMSSILVKSYVKKYADLYSNITYNIKKDCRLSGKIVVITGAAQGFGRGIAEQLFEHGANLVLADINGDGVKELSEEMNNKSGFKRAVGVAADVTNKDDVMQMFRAAVLEFGGLDIFINNAGIVKAGGVDELSFSDFQLVTNVNYTAYFTGVKFASEILKLQHSVKNDYFTDIIEINSKSGLEGSNKNFAYSGSKFGGLGLTQSFALELAQYNIKVNAVCPGNYLDGPLWSDPDHGLFKQYLRAGKIPGAKTIADVRKYYENKVPLGRGCRVEDVVRAIIYIHEQQYETGQAIPVTGGQIMLN